MLPILQCGKCLFKLRLDITKDNFPGVSVCEQYPNKVPDYILEAKRDCPKFKPKEK